MERVEMRFEIGATSVAGGYRASGFCDPAPRLRAESFDGNLNER